MLEARIYEAGAANVNGYVYTADELAEAVNKFDNELVMFGGYPGYSPTDMSRVAAQVTLRMEGNDVIATVKLLDTPMGRIVTQLHESNLSIKIVPVAQRTVREGGITGFIIHRLVIPSDLSTITPESPLRRIKRWLTGDEEQYVLFELKEHKY